MHERAGLALRRLAFLEREDGLGEGRGEEKRLAFRRELVDQERELGSKCGRQKAVRLVEDLRDPPRVSIAPLRRREARDAPRT